nr:MAG TPA: hypothetical protein [Caudoviricetes sp.]
MFWRLFIQKLKQLTPIRKEEEVWEELIMMK